MLTHDEAISLFLDVTGSCGKEIELNELFETESDEFTLIMPSALKVDWREQIITRVKETLSMTVHAKPITRSGPSSLRTRIHSRAASPPSAFALAHCAK
jgi:hypothetical protein